MPEPAHNARPTPLDELEPERLSAVRDTSRQLVHLGVPVKALEPVRDWLAAREERAEELHRQHMSMCGITSLAGHGHGWGNCPAFICNHCGSPPDADGDHSCPCPHRDEECPDHA